MDSIDKTLAVDHERENIIGAILTTICPCDEWFVRFYWRTSYEQRLSEGCDAVESRQYANQQLWRHYNTL